MRGISRYVWIGWCGALGLVAIALPARAQTPVRVVVHAANPATTITRELAEQLFLKQRTQWSNKMDVMVVDQAERSPVRQVFSERILHRQVNAVKRYWQGMVFTGATQPPVEVAADADVLRLVQGNPRAVGYVSVDAPLPPGVKELAISGT